MKSPLTFVDLFCGCGGFTLGMLRAGFQCKAAIDFNHQAVETLKTNLSGRCPLGATSVEQALEKDLTSFPPAELAALIGTNRLDVIVGGPPCQGFSTARQRDGSNHGDKRFKEEDPRRYLYRSFLNYVEFFQPRVFVIENVLGLRNAAGGRYFTAVQHEARVLGRYKGLPGYRVHGQIEKAEELGVPQKRRRQLIIGVRADLPGYFPSELEPAARATPKTMLGDAIGDLPVLAAGEGVHAGPYNVDRRNRLFLGGVRNNVRRRYLYKVAEVRHAKLLTNHVARPHSARDLRDFALLPEGTSSAKLMRKGVEFEFPYDKTTFEDRYTRQHRNRPCSTIVAHLSKDGLMFIHPTQNRSLTPREAARVQSFPDWFGFPKSRTQSFRLIGNAVPPLISEAVGLTVTEFFESTAASAIPATTLAGKKQTRREIALTVPSCADSAVRKQAFVDHRARTSCGSAEQNDQWGHVLGSRADAALELERLAKLDRRALLALPKEEFLRGWHALLFLFPGLHPDNALDHGDYVETVPINQLALPGFEELLSRRYTRSGWPVALELIGCEAWRRYRAGFLRDGEIYCSEAQMAGMCHHKTVPTEEACQSQARGTV